ncbi:MAG TPA: LolA-related protein [Trinickia sp.]|jgi:outer membrane lipoprotein-sorting protein|nr:LolA-related protein [Trinickia sp.]
MTVSPHFFGFRPRVARSLAVIAATIVALSAPLSSSQAAAANPSDWTLDQLMSMLAQKKTGRASFVERKYLSIAAQPVESSGELVFMAPDHLEKITASPKPERVVVDGDTLTVERNQRNYTLALDRYPELAAFIESIRATMAGDRNALEHVYNVALSSRGDDWTLTLTPLDSRTSKVIRAIALDGTLEQLRSVTIQQADGDHSVMQLRNAASD